MVVVWLIGIALGLLSRADALQVPTVAALSGESLREALELGRSGNPRGHEMLVALGTTLDGPAKPDKVTAIVYTPFVRVAMWAHMQADGSAGDRTIPAELLASVVLVAFKKEPSCCPEMAPEPPLDVRAVIIDPAKLLVPSLSAGRVADARWTSTDVTVLSLFDPDAHLETDAVAAFAIEDFQPGRAVAAHVMRQDVAREQVLKVFHYGVISASWR